MDTDKLIIAAITGYCICALIFLWLVPKLHLRNKELKDSEKLTLLFEGRKTYVQIFGGIALVVGVFSTWQTVRLSSDAQMTDRFSRAVQQLANERVEVRLGGVYSLDRLYQDSERDRVAITDVLAQCLRTNAHYEKSDNFDYGKALVTSRNDVEYILKFLGRRSRIGEPPTYQLDLSFTDLSGLSLNGLDLSGSDMHQTNLSATNLGASKLDNANLAGANLSEVQGRNASFRAANFESSEMRSANLQNSDLRGASLKNTRLRGARLDGAKLDGADLTGADVNGSDFDEATLTGTILNGVDLTNVTGISQKNFDGAKSDADTKRPQTFAPDEN